MNISGVPTKLRGGTATSADGTRIAFLALGRGPRLVFLPGGLGAGWSYKAVADHLASQFESILVDRRGLGRSDFGVEPYNLEKEAEDVFAVVSAVGSVDAVVGHSHGAAVALLAARADDNGAIPKLVLYEPALGPDVGAIQVDMVAAMRASVLAGDYEDGVGAYFDKVADLLPASAEGIAALKQSPAWPSFVAQAPTLMRGDLIASLTASEFTGVAIPTLLVYGSETIEPHKVIVRELDEALPNAKVSTLDGQGHVANTEAPDLLADVIAGFIA